MTAGSFRLGGMCSFVGSCMSTSATQPRMFLYHHEATTFSDSSKRPSSFYEEYAGKPTSFSIPTRPLSSKETYGFKSTKNPPPIEELKDFENDMLKMIQSVKFKQVNNPFLNKLKEDADRNKNEPKLLIAAHKTTNFYKLEPSTYNGLLEKTSQNLTRKHNPRQRKQSIKKTKPSRQN